MNRLEAMQKRLRAHRANRQEKQTELLLVKPSKNYVYRPKENTTTDQCVCRCGVINSMCPYFGREIEIEVYD